MSELVSFELEGGPTLRVKSSKGNRSEESRASRAHTHSHSLDDSTKRRERRNESDAKRRPNDSQTVRHRSSLVDTSVARGHAHALSTAPCSSSAGGKSVDQVHASFSTRLVDIRTVSEKIESLNGREAALRKELERLKSRTTSSRAPLVAPPNSVARSPTLPPNCRPPLSSPNSRRPRTPPKFRPPLLPKCALRLRPSPVLVTRSTPLTVALSNDKNGDTVRLGDRPQSVLTLSPKAVFIPPTCHTASSSAKPIDQRTLCPVASLTKGPRVVPRSSAECKSLSEYRQPRALTEQVSNKDAMPAALTSYRLVSHHTAQLQGTRRRRPVSHDTVAEAHHRPRVRLKLHTRVRASVDDGKYAASEARHLRSDTNAAPANCKLKLIRNFPRKMCAPQTSRQFGAVGVVPRIDATVRTVGDGHDYDTKTAPNETCGGISSSRDVAKPRKPLRIFPSGTVEVEDKKTLDAEVEASSLPHDVSSHLISSQKSQRRRELPYSGEIEWEIPTSPKQSKEVPLALEMECKSALPSATQKRPIVGFVSHSQSPKKSPTRCVPRSSRHGERQRLSPLLARIEGDTLGESPHSPNKARKKCSGGPSTCEAKGKVPPSQSRKSPSLSHFERENLGECSKHSHALQKECSYERSPEAEGEASPSPPPRNSLQTSCRSDDTGISRSSLSVSKKTSNSASGEPIIVREHLSSNLPGARLSSATRTHLGPESPVTVGVHLPQPANPCRAVSATFQEEGAVSSQVLPSATRPTSPMGSCGSGSPSPNSFNGKERNVQVQHILCESLSQTVPIGTQEEGVGSSPEPQQIKRQTISLSHSKHVNAPSTSPNEEPKEPRRNASSANTPVVRLTSKREASPSAVRKYASVAAAEKKEVRVRICIGCSQSIPIFF